MGLMTWILTLAQARARIARELGPLVPLSLQLVQPAPIVYSYMVEAHH